MNFTLHQLQIFREVVRQESVTRAAEVLHMTQPAVSIQLKNFQQQFDVPLTEIIGRQLHVTDFGREVADLADNTLSEAAALEYKTQEYQGLLTGKLRVSSASTGKYVAPYFLGGFTGQYPGVDLTLDVSNKTHVVRQLKENAVDFAFVSVLPDDVDLYEEHLLENALYLVGNTPKRDKKLPLIYREPGSATRGAMDTYFGEADQRKRIELTSNEAVKQAVIAGLGQSILPIIGIGNELEQGQLHLLKAKGLPLITTWRLVWLKQKRLSPVAEAYLAFVRAHKQDIVERYFRWTRSV